METMLWDFGKPKAIKRDWPLIDSPVPVFTLLGIYAIFALKIGKIFMRNRPPYNVRKAMLIYNAVQIIYNSILFGYCLKYIVLTPLYDLSCIEGLAEDHPKKYIEQNVMYAYYMNKILDLADTIFFVLRKSYKQITLLHVYHHGAMILGVYCFMRFYGTGGHPGTLGVLNTLVHIVMYTYYFLSALSERVRKTLWWKRYLTIIQMIQFFIYFAHTLLVLSTNCPFPRHWLTWSLAQSILMMAMFSNFYVRAYVLTPERLQQCLKEKMAASQIKQN